MPWMTPVWGSNDLLRGPGCHGVVKGHLEEEQVWGEKYKCRFQCVEFLVLMRCPAGLSVLWAVGHKV